MPTDSIAERRELSSRRPTSGPAGRIAPRPVVRTGAAQRLVRQSFLLLLGSVLVLSGSLSACSLRRAVVVEDLLEPMGQEGARVPTASDLAAARLARIALVAPPGSPSIAQAKADLADVAPDEHANRLLHLATDLQNATLADPLAQQEAARKLRRTLRIDPRLSGRLDDTLAQDPLAQARLRTIDGWHRLFARTFNSVAQPLGQTAITGFFLAPYHLANSFIHYFAEFSNSEPISTTGRQALALRETFLAAHPESRIAPKVERLVERDRRRLAKTLARRSVRAAEKALDGGEARLARHHARVALDQLATEPDANTRLRRRAERLAARAQTTITNEDRLARRSLEARATDAATRSSELALASALLAGPAKPADLAPALAAYASAAEGAADTSEALVTGDTGDSEEAKRAGGASGAGGDPSRTEHWAGRVAFIAALAQAEDGHEEAARRRLADLAGSAQADDPMTRHARQLVEDEWQNPYDAFLRLRRTGRREALAHRLAGEWVNRPRYPNIWPPVAYLIDTPTIAMTLVLAPLRALISPFTGFPDFQRATAQAGYRYLQRHPEGAHQREIVDWLYTYERDGKHASRALRLADLKPDFPADERRELVEEAADEQTKNLDRVDRRDQRASVLRGVATDYPDSAGGREAGLKAREEIEEASPQNIRITRSFLVENPSVAFDGGLGLNPVLLNGDPRDGELDDEGVVLRGGRVLEVRLRAEGRDEDAEPVARMRRISKRRLMRLTAALDEAVRRNSLIDEGARFAPDANRETYLEKARLGLTEEADLRPTAESDFVYQSLRERYGAVRGRDSILPFDLVFRGSLGDFSLGAFPRWRAPRETDDAYLYR